MRLKSLIALGAITLGSLIATASASPTPIATFNAPPPADNAFGTSITYGPDGLIYAFDGRNVLKEDGINASTFSTLSTSPTTVNGADAGPIGFSQNGQTILVGTGFGGADFASAGIVLTTNSGIGNSPGAFTQMANVVPNHFYFTAVTGLSSILNSSNLMVVNQGNASFTGSSVSYYSLADQSNITVIDGITGASTAVAYDSAGNLYVGVGFGANRGEIRRFSTAAVDAAYNSNTPIDYTTGEILHTANDNSGTGYFIADGHLFAGGGTDGGLTVIDLSQISNPAYQGVLYNLGKGFASIYYNAVNDQFAVTDFDGSIAVFDVAQFLPEPGALCLIALAGCGLLARRRAA